MSLRHLAYIAITATALCTGCKPAECESVLALGGDVKVGLSSKESLGAARDKADELAKAAAGSGSHEIEVLGKRAAAVRDLIDKMNAAEEGEKTSLVDQVYNKQAGFGSALGMVAEQCL